jgi:hypothetical protein
VPNWPLKGTTYTDLSFSAGAVSAGAFGPAPDGLFADEPDAVFFFAGGAFGREPEGVP